MTAVRWPTLQRLVWTLLGVGALSTCGSDSPGGPGGGTDQTGTIVVDATPLITMGDPFHIGYDRVVLVVKQSGLDTAIVFREFTGAALTARPLILSVSVPLAQEPENLVVSVHGFAGGVPYFEVHDSGGLERGDTLSCTGMEPSYSGEALFNTSLQFGNDTTVERGDSVLLTAQVYQGGVLLPPTPVMFLSNDTARVQIHRPAGQPFNLAWAVAGRAGGGPAVIAALTPYPLGPYLTRQVMLVPRTLPSGGHLTALAPLNQSASPLNSVADPPGARATDAAGHPVPYLDVVFTADPCHCGELLDGVEGPVTVTTDLTGAARLHSWLLGSISGRQYSVSAGGLTFKAMTPP